MADGKIYITITDEPTGNGIGNGSKRKTAEQKEKEKKEQLNYQFYEFIKEQAIKVATYSVENIGFFTGNYQQQRDMTTAISLGYKAISIGNAIGRSIAMGSPIPAIVTIGALAISTGLEAGKIIEQNKRDNYEINLLKQISGLNSRTNGSR